MPSLHNGIPNKANRGDIVFNVGTISYANPFSVYRWGHGMGGGGGACTQWFARHRRGPHPTGAASGMKMGPGNWQPLMRRRGGGSWRGQCGHAPPPPRFLLRFIAEVLLNIGHGPQSRWFPVKGQRTSRGRTAGASRAAWGPSPRLQDRGCKGVDGFAHQPPPQKETCSGFSL